MKKFGSNYRAEVLAYEFDQLIGFDQVPITVAREIDGKKGSMQLFTKSLADNPNGPKPNRAMYMKELDKQSLFDYLISNSDRHKDNILYLENGKVVSIDNGISFDSPRSLHFKTFRERRAAIERFISTEEGQKIMNKLKSLDLDKFKKEVTEYIESKQQRSLSGE